MPSTRTWRTNLTGGIVALGLFGAGAGVAIPFADSSPILIQSLESKTEDGAPVFNRISFSGGPGQARDVWRMSQTHRGLGLPRAEWDRLEIVVDKSSRPYRALFYQLRPGTSTDEAAPLRARCFACHANGPRAIRPDFAAADASARPVFRERLRLALWNLEIKTYGHVRGEASAASLQASGAASTGASFRSAEPLLARPLGLATCLRCHSENGIREPLRLEQVGTARFLVDGGFMPPFPFRATAEEKARLRAWAGTGER